MRTGFCDPTLPHDIDPITVPDGSQAVGDYNAGRIAAGLRDRILDAGFYNGVKIARRLVQNQMPLLLSASAFLFAMPGVPRGNFRAAATAFFRT